LDFHSKNFTFPPYRQRLIGLDPTPKVSNS
jgi:hypothetical protein